MVSGFVPGTCARLCNGAHLLRRGARWQTAVRSPSPSPASNKKRKRSFYTVSECCGICFLSWVDEVHTRCPFQKQAARGADGRLP